MSLYAYDFLHFNRHKGVAVQVEHYERLKKYYSSNFRDFFKVKNLKSILGEFDCDALFRCSGRGYSRSIILNPTVTKKLANALNPHYENVLKNVEYMIHNTINIIETDDVYGCVLFGILLFKREKNEVKAYVRRNLELPENKRTRLNDCYILDEKNWLEINKFDLLRERVNELISEALNRDKKSIINRLIAIATNIEFYQGEVSHLSVLGINGVGNKSFVISNLEKFNPKDFQYLRGTMASKSHVYTNNVQYAFRQIAGLYILVAEHDTYLSENNFEGILKDNTALLRQAIKRIFNLKHNKVAELAYEGLVLAAGNAWFYTEENCSKFVERDVFLHNHQRLMDLFGNDSGKLSFVFSLVGQNVHPDAVMIQDDYFAYEKLISTNPFNLKDCKFPSKSTLRDFLKLDAGVISRVVLYCKTKGTNRYVETLWRNIMFYLYYFNSNFKNLNFENFERAQYHISILCQNYPKEKIDKEVCANIARAVELILELAASSDYASLEELVDYMNGNKYQVKKKNKLVKTRQKNIFDMSKSMSLKQAMVLQNEWHIAVVEYEMREDLDNDNLALNLYSHLRDIEVLIDGLRFKAILNKYELIKETQLLKHCVITYHSVIKDKNYIVFALTDTNMSEDRNRTNAYTLGCNINSNGDLTFNQVRGFCNSGVPSTVELAINKFLSQCKKGDIAIYKNQQKTMAA